MGQILGPMLQKKQRKFLLVVFLFVAWEIYFKVRSGGQKTLSGNPRSILQPDVGQKWQ